MKNLFFLLLCSCFLGQYVWAQNFGFTLKSNITFNHINNELLSNIWGYAANGREYAIVGTKDGATIVDVTDPTAPDELFHIDCNNSIWREPKVWGHYAYVVTEGGGGMLIIDLANLPNSAPHTFWTGGALPNGNNYTNSSSHDLFTDNNGYLYLTGSNTYQGLVALNLNASPTNPPIVGAFNNIYVHDGFARNDTIWNANINDGVFTVLNATNKNNMTTMATQATTDNFTHNTALSDNGRYLFTTDESMNGGIDSYDVSDLTDIKRLDHFAAAGTVHNCYFQENFLICSYYQDGVRAFDVTYPQQIIEVAHYDTSPNYAGQGYDGCWGVYPYLPSGNVLASDQQAGMYVLEPTYQHACFLTGNITNANTNASLANANIQISGVASASTSSGFAGNYLTGFPNSGTYTVTVSKSGYASQTFTVTFTNGVTQTLNVALVPGTPFALTGQVTNAQTGVAINNANVVLTDGTTNYAATANASGNYSISLPGAGIYTVYAGKWGYQTMAVNNANISSSSSPLNIALTPGYYDDFLFDFGWTVASTATAGLWARGEPIGTVSAGYPANPDFDVDNDLGDQCYVTGNANTTEAALDDIDGGHTILTSPIFDLSTYNDAKINFSWYFRYSGGNTTPDDHTYIRLTNGITTVDLRDIVETTEPEAEWFSDSIEVADYITPTANMRLIIDASDTGSGHLVEVAFDRFIVTDLAPDVPSLLVKARVWLEGAYNIGTHQMNTSLKTANVLPIAQPYFNIPWNYTGTEAVANANAIPVNIVDWVLVELRSATSPTTIVARRAAWLRNDGVIVDIEGTEGVKFYGLSPTGGNYYLAVRHRNHLAVASVTPVALPNAVAYDFNTPANVYGGVNQLSRLEPNVYALSSGDVNANGVINYTDYNLSIAQQSGSFQYAKGDCNLNGTVSTSDFNYFQPNAGKLGITLLRY